MNRLSVVIPSRNPKNFGACVDSIFEREPESSNIRVVCVDDFRTNEDRSAGRSSSLQWSRRNISFVPGSSPFCFARNVNAGLRAVPSDDVVVMNDDALLTYPQGLSKMQQIAYSDAGRAFGLLSATCDNVGNVNQHAPQRIGASTDKSIRLEPRMVCFVCVFIPRVTLDLVGPLDERFVDYGLDDDDYCLRVRQMGRKIGIYDGCNVDHSSLTSSFRGDAGHGGDYTANMRRYIEKWGEDNRGHRSGTSPFAALFPKVGG